MKYTKQAITLKQQIKTLQDRGLIFTFREESLYAQLCCMAYWLKAIDVNNTFVGDLKLLLLRYHDMDISTMGFPANWQKEPLWQF